MRKTLMHYLDLQDTLLVEVVEEGMMKGVVPMVFRQTGWFGSRIPFQRHYQCHNHSRRLL